MQARNHENSDEIRPTPVRHLDLATPAFTITVRTPSVTTLFGEKKYEERVKQQGCARACNPQVNNLANYLAFHLDFSLMALRPFNTKVG